MNQINPDLNDAQRAVLFDASTEPPFSGELLHVDSEGTFTCANCHSQLFASDRKYDSVSGWPSFDDALPGAVELHDDDSFGMRRNAVTCAKCGGHLGHAFPDGPVDTTGMRYCINSLSLEFDKN